MEKENIYVTIDSEEKRLRAIEILDGKDEVCIDSILLKEFSDWFYIGFNAVVRKWMRLNFIYLKREITLEELELLLDSSVDLTSYVVKDVVLSIDELKTQAAALGYKLVEKPCEPKVGDFGLFWDFNENVSVLDYVLKIFKEGGNVYYGRKGDLAYNHFRKLTESEKQKIQSAW
jgi:hypothetical protein